MLVNLELSRDKLLKKIEFVSKTIDDFTKSNYTDMVEFGKEKIKKLNKLLETMDSNKFFGYISDGIYDYYLEYYTINDLAICKDTIQFPELYKIEDPNWKLSYGYADNLEQVLELYSDVLESPDHKYIIAQKIVKFPTSNDIYKHGNYIGFKEKPLKQDSICKYRIYEII